MKIMNAAGKFPRVPIGFAPGRNDRDLILDRLGDALFIADELRSSIRFDNPENQSIAWVGTDLDKMYTDVNEIMKKLSS